MNWLQFLKVMEVDEKAAWTKYDLAAKASRDPELKAMLLKLRDEEEVHADFLADQYKKLEKEQKK
jgi:rubrerythrin